MQIKAAQNQYLESICDICFLLIGRNCSNKANKFPNNGSQLLQMLSRRERLSVMDADPPPPQGWAAPISLPRAALIKYWFHMTGGSAAL